jgi:hypothetical protein
VAARSYQCGAPVKKSACRPTDGHHAEGRRVRVHLLEHVDPRPEVVGEATQVVVGHKEEEERQPVEEEAATAADHQAADEEKGEPPVGQDLDALDDHQ